MCRMVTYVLWAQKGRVDFGPAGEGVGAIYDIKSAFDSAGQVENFCVAHVWVRVRVRVYKVWARHTRVQRDLTTCKQRSSSA